MTLKDPELFFWFLVSLFVNFCFARALLRNKKLIVMLQEELKSLGESDD